VLSYAEAVAAVTAPGERFEIERIAVRGVEVNAFRHAPPSLRALFATWRGRGDATFLVYEDERWGFDDVVAHMDALGAALVERYGVGPGDRVAIGMRNFPEWVVAFAAITSIGAVSVSLNAWWTPDELDFALGDSGATVLLADVERVERTREAAARLGVRTIGVRLPAGHESVAGAGGVDRYEEVVVPLLGTPLPDVEVDPDDDATILYTSGTTGRPKGAVSTNRAVLQALMAFACRTAVARLRHPDEARAAEAQPPVFILIVPLFHVTGSVPVMLSCLSSGLKLVIMHHWDAERALELIEAERVTNFVGVPTQSHDLVSSPRFGEFDTSSLVSVGGGGAPTPAKLVAKVDESFTKARPNIGYGMTETNSYGPGNSGDDYVTHPTSTGRLVAIADIEARDPDGNPLPTGATGELWMTGPHLIRGYWNRPEATAETIVDGWLRTGDIGHVDAEGFVYVSDRAKDMVLRGGENVYCAEVEDALYEHPGVHEAAVFGIPDERLGETVAASVLPKPGVALTEDELRAFVAERLAAFKVPDRIDVRTEPLPRNAAGKFLKRDLRTELFP
jgi:long-chain acyl-CoA synthetase